MFFIKPLQKLNIFNLFICCFFLSACDLSTKKEAQSLKGFNSDGFENFKIGNDSDDLTEVEDSRIDNCYMAVDQSNNDIEYQVIDNKISVISTMQHGRTTYEGIAVGDLEKRIYGEKHKNGVLDKRKNPYGNPEKDYSIIYWNDDNKKLGTRYDIEDGVIMGIKVGDHNLTLMEGCA
ncbi:hypothetical protein HMP0015_2920 [Acinetobacter haemolyticus ATCC 19194]|uniref:Lipoprotein n=1 Tax=Acinetobacter haemolyticus ATCC 19194 TaxID=707232 RepID=D4XT78_ACIHA|nr:hypothetical protein [Acinetobacter haemolyticus]EFF81607.1 hypothetical protein HMP0015_2920 [Acinetobacter haemolyticus ATCC 19194]